MQQRVTLLDVARHAGVSASTASRALSNDGSVKDRTAERVKTSANALNYHPNIIARQLSGGESDLMCLMVPSLTGQTLSRFYYASLIAGAEETAHRHGLHLIIKNKKETDDFFELVDQNRIGGVLLRVGHNQTLEQTYIRRLRKAKTPFVIIGKPFSPRREPAIHIDIVGGARALAHHFAEQGYQKILFISGPKRNSDSNDRYYGFRIGLAERGYRENQLLFAQGDYTPESGYRAAEEHIRPDEIDAVFAATDHSALGVLTYCASRGISVPRHVAVAGYDDQDYAAYTWPPLTTVRQPVQELGRHAMEQLINVMRSTTKREDTMILAPSVVIRESTLRNSPGARIPRKPPE
ncbi:MAG: LacI family transcriptional regulator [Spirochaetaceae bacterium]|nr:MAG: LacI family transcriptional regulator [Spirochaetaceae bacterium]